MQLPGGDNAFANRRWSIHKGLAKSFLKPEKSQTTKVLEISTQNPKSKTRAQVSREWPQHK